MFTFATIWEIPPNIRSGHTNVPTEIWLPKLQKVTRIKYSDFHARPISFQGYTPTYQVFKQARILFNHAW